MTDRIDPATLTDPRDQAACWHARLQSDDVTDQERAAFERWRQSDPENARRYQRVLDIWAIADALPKSQVGKLGRDRPSWAERKRPWFRRPAWGYGLGLACCAVLLFLMTDPAGWRETPNYQAEFRTAHGERRQVVLPDDSMLVFNTDTVATVRFFKNRRSVQLAQGEAFFQVKGMQGTPFIVDVDTGTVRVTGTEFNVRRAHDDVFGVGVLQGSVEVETGPWWRRTTVALGPGNAARSTAAGDISVQGDVDVGSVVAWREGKVVFRGTPLAQAIQEVNRYAQQRLTIADASTGRLRVSGVFSIDDPASFVDSLPQIVPVVVRERSAGVIEILPR